MPSAPHTSCAEGKRVSVKLRNGEVVVGKFSGKASRFIWVGDTKVNRKEIRSFLIAKHITEEE